MMYLYRHGFPYHQLGHVHSGNVFVANDICRLGGYENTLVGYRTRLFRLCRHHEDRIDIVMFGKAIIRMHVLTVVGKCADSAGLREVANCGTFLVCPLIV